LEIVAAPPPATAQAVAHLRGRLDVPKGSDRVDAGMADVEGCMQLPSFICRLVIRHQTTDNRTTRVTTLSTAVCIVEDDL
jgi:hypothetical protein